jgi:hypothetical protein
MASVRRGGVNRLEFPGVILKFQLYPGSAGTNAERGISGIDYTVKILGVLWQADTTDAEGTVNISMPPGFATCVLRIFDIDYTVNVLPSIDPLVALHMSGVAAFDVVPNLPALRRRLELLGHNVGNVDDDTLGEEAEDSILHLQTNAGLEIDGLAGNQTKTAIARAVGES